MNTLRRIANQMTNTYSTSHPSHENKTHLDWDVLALGVNLSRIVHHCSWDDRGWLQVNNSSAVIPNAHASPVMVTVNLSTSKNSGAIRLAVCCSAASAKRCFCKIRETEASKERMHFDVSMYNSTLAIHVKVMQSICDSDVQRTRVDIRILRIIEGIFPTRRWGHYGRSMIDGSCGPKYFDNVPMLKLGPNTDYCCSHL